MAHGERRIQPTKVKRVQALDVLEALGMRMAIEATTVLHWHAVHHGASSDIATAKVF